MNPQVEESIGRIAGRARNRYENIVSGARSQTAEAANRVRKGKDPVRALSKLGIELTSISHKATADVLKSQTRLIEHQIDALAGRLHAAASAQSLRDLVRGQIRLIPQNASRFVEDTRQTLSIVAVAGGEVRGAVAHAAGDLRGRQPAAKKAAGKKAPASRKTAKKSTRKAASRTAVKKTAPKKTARKKTARKKTVRKSARTAPATATVANSTDTNSSA